MTPNPFFFKAHTKDMEKRKFILARPLSEKSLLPSSTISTSKAKLIIEDDLCMVITLCEPLDEYYELQWITPEEVVFVSSILVASHPDKGKPFIFPHNIKFTVDENWDAVDDKTLAKSARDTVIEGYGNILSRQGFEYYKNELPPLYTFKRYEKNPHIDCSDDYVKYLSDQIDPKNVLLIRGLSHFIKSTMLQRLGRTFYDTAALEMYISLEATFQLLSKELNSQGIKNPSSKEVSDYYLESMGFEHRLSRYYEEFWDDRIKSIHPSSRFGEEYLTPIITSDLYMLHNDLLRTWEFIITKMPFCYRKYYDEVLTSNSNRLPNTAAAE